MNVAFSRLYQLAQPGVCKFEASAPWTRLGGPTPELGFALETTARKKSDENTDLIAQLLKIT